jgi:hypothetical protein
VTGNWPISRRKALAHPEIQPDKKETTPTSEGPRHRQIDSDNTPKTSRHIRDLGKNKSPSTRRRYSVISKGFEAQESKIASLSSRIASLEEEVGVQEGESSNSEVEELPVIHTRTGREVKKPRKY